MRGCLRRADVLARLGGDEFAILADGLRTQDQMRSLADKIRQTLSSRPLEVIAQDGTRATVELPSSIGASLRRAGVDGVGMMVQADAAMYRDKGRRRVPG